MNFIEIIFNFHLPFFKHFAGTNLCLNYFNQERVTQVAASSGRSQHELEVSSLSWKDHKAQQRSSLKGKIVLFYFYFIFSRETASRNAVIIYLFICLEIKHRRALGDSGTAGGSRPTLPQVVKRPSCQKPLHKAIACQANV